MTAGDNFYARFWGVRGSIACPGPDTVRYGGNTSCVEVHCGDATIILDAGTGIRELGDTLMKNTPAWTLQIILPIGFGLMAYRHLVLAIKRPFGLPVDPVDGDYKP